jgi:hypothetical protein|tara:strand:+ start:1987 stop:2673 length:687 start_codon:yes stop_codon:yes gene_type:complete
MKNKKTKISVVLILALSLPLSTISAKDAPPETSFDGLNLVKSEKHSLAYLRDNTDFSEYDKIFILPSQVAFKKNWQRNYNNDHMMTSRIKNSDVEKIKNGVAKLFDETFTEYMAKVKGYTVVAENGPGVLILKPAIINLDVHAPDIKTANRTATFAETAGAATLYLEFYDGVSNEILARVADAKQTRNRGYHSWSNRITNSADAKQLIGHWAQQLTEILEDIGDIKGK